jgi:hypothetical protein
MTGKPPPLPADSQSWKGTGKMGTIVGLNRLKFEEKRRPMSKEQSLIREVMHFVEFSGKGGLAEAAFPLSATPTFSNFNSPLFPCSLFPFYLVKRIIQKKIIIGAPAWQYPILRVNCKVICCGEAQGAFPLVIFEPAT